MRPVLWLLLAAFLLMIGVWPAIAVAVGGTVGLVMAGGFQLLAQPPVFALAAGLLAVAVFRRRPAAAGRAV